MKSEGRRTKVVWAARVVLLAWLALLGCGVGTAHEPGVAPQAAPVAAVCPPGEWPDDAGRCLPAEVTLLGEGGTAYWVDQSHPEADDANPGTRERPWRTIGRALDALRPGDAVLVREGVYRESLQPRRGGEGPDARITLAAYPGDEVVVAGHEFLDGGWREGDVWLFPWLGGSLPPYGSTSDPVFRRELVGVGQGRGARVLRPVTSRSDLAPGTFFVEGAAVAPMRVLVRFPAGLGPLEGTPVWMARRAVLFAPRGADPYLPCGDPATPGWFRLVGLTFRFAANYAQEGAVCAGSAGGLVEHVTVEWTNAVGLDASGRGHVFTEVRASHNGQLGIGGGCAGCVFDGGEVVGNNWKGYDPLWEAGGVKLMRTRDTVVRGLRVRGNDGPGVWLDTDNARNTIEGCLVEDNAVAGIMLEYATTETLVQHNVIRGTRFRGYSGAGILSQAASHNLLLHNTLLGNEGDGIWLRLDPDRRAPDGHTAVFNNVLAGNGWTATEEGREISVEGASLAHARTHALDGNRYGRHARSDWRTSTFFFVPDPTDEAGFRGDDLARWRRLTGGEAHSRLHDPDALLGGSARLGEAVALPAAWRAVGAASAPPRLRPEPGAEADRIRAVSG